MKLDKPLNLTFTQPQPGKRAIAKSREDAAQTPELTIEALEKELQAKNKLIEAKNQEISELKIKNRQLQSENQESRERQTLMDEELRKAEAQIELIMELINETPDTLFKNTPKSR